MVGKNNQYVKKIKQGTKVETYSIKKFKVGIASVAIGCSVFFGAGAVAMAGEQPVATGADTVSTSESVAPKAEIGATTAGTAAVTSRATVQPQVTEEKLTDTVNTTKLETLIKEVEGLNLEKYTEESALGLKVRLAKAKDALVNAKNQKELDSAYNALVGYKNSSLKLASKPKKDDTHKIDTTGGKETVGKKAENTEPNGTNIAGHNHSLAGTTLPEGSGFRAVPAGDAYFNFDSGTLETEVGSAPNAKFLAVWRKKQGYKPQLTSDGLGIRLEYDRQIPDNDFVKRIFRTVGSINTVGSYDVAFEMKDGSSGVLYDKKSYKVSVKPLAPRVTVENLENAAGTRAKVTATARNPQYSSGEQPGESSVDFYVNGVKKQTVTAVNGVAEWTPTEAFNANDRITATNTARDKQFLPSQGTNISVPITATTSNMSSEVRIPAPTTPSVDLEALKTAAKADLAKAATEEKAEIAGDKSLTTAKRAEKEKAVDDKKAEEEAKITAADNADKVEAAKTAGVAAIKAVHTVGSLDNLKAAAKADLAKAATEEKAEIAGDKSLTAAQRAEKEKAVDTTKASEEAKITAAETADAVEAAKTAGVTAIKAVHTVGNLDDVKATAKAALEAAATEEKAEIAGDKSLTAAQRAEKEKAVDTTKASEEAKITAADNADKVEAAKTAGVTAIKAVHTVGSLDNLKAAAITEIDAALVAKNKTVDINDDLTIEEKSEVKKQTQKEATDAIENIGKAIDADEVLTSTRRGIAAVNGVALPTETAKAKAITEIKAALATKEKATDEDKALTKGQKTSIKEIAKKEAMAATVEIKAATTNKDVEEAKNEGIEKIKAAYARNAELAAELTLPKLIITKWQDEAGNDLRPADAKVPAEPGGTNKALAHGEIAGYEFVATRNAGEVVTHIFRKLPKKSPIIEEGQLPVVENVNTKTVLPNTGANTTNTGLAGLGLAMFGGLLTVARQRRRNK